MADQRDPNDPDRFYAPSRQVGTLTILKDIFLSKIGLSSYLDDIERIRTRLENIPPSSQNHSPQVRFK